MTLAQQAALATASHVLSNALPLPELPISFYLNCAQQAAHSTSNLCDEVDVQTSVTFPKASQVLSHTEAGPCTDFHLQS